MLAVDRKLFIFRIREMYFCDHPFEVNGCDRVLFTHCRNKVNVDGFTCTRVFTSIIDLTPDLDTIWGNLDKKSTKYEVKRAEGEGIGVHINRHFTEFHGMNRSLERKKRVTPLLGTGITPETMRRYGTLFTAESGGEILGGHLYLEDETHIRLWLSASKRLEADRGKAALIGRANRLLHWEAMKYARAKGIKEFDWGGLWSAEEAARDPLKQNINSFKQSFGGKTVECYDYTRVYSRAYRLAQSSYRLVNRMLK